MIERRYVPRGGLPVTVLDPRAWPPLGRVGYCAAGPDWAGCYVSVRVLNTEEPPFWGILAENLYGPHREFFQTDIVQDDTDGWLSKMIADNPIEWAPDELDDLIESRVFGERRIIREVVAAGDWTSDILSVDVDIEVTTAMREAADDWPQTR